MKPTARTAALLGAAAASIGVMLALALLREAPPTVEQRPPDAAAAPAMTFLDVGIHGALLTDHRRGSVRAVDSRGQTLWNQPGSSASQCLGCPTALLVDPLRRRSADGRIAPVRGLDGTTPYNGVYLRRRNRWLEVLTLRPDGPRIIGRLPSRSLDPAAYASAPSVAVASDGLAATAIVGDDDPLSVGQVDAVFLQFGQPAIHHRLTLSSDRNPPATCQPTNSRTWGWLSQRMGIEPWQGTSQLTITRGSETAKPIRLAHPYSACLVTRSGFVLTYRNIGPTHSYSGAALVDRSGKVRWEETRTGDRPGSDLSVSDAGRVVLPAGSGFDVITPGHKARHIEADDVRMAADGTLWVLRGERARISR